MINYENNNYTTSDFPIHLYRSQAVFEVLIRSNIGLYKILHTVYKKGNKYVEIEIIKFDFTGSLTLMLCSNVAPIVPKNIEIH